MRFAITPKQWEPTIEALKDAGHELSDLDGAELLIYNGSADSFPELPESVRWVQLGLAGIDAFFDRGIITEDRLWSNCAGVYGRPVAESAAALLLSALHLFPEIARRDSWDTTGSIDARTRWLYDTHVAVIGAGGIGAELVPMLTGFGCEVTCVNNSGRPIPGATSTVDASHTDEVLAAADHVILAAPLTETTRGMINKRTLGLMKKTAILINVGRGPLVVTDDLVEALRDGVIAGAALDVTDPEPLPEGHALWGMDNVLITPHVANTAANIPYLITPAILANIEAYSRGETMPTAVDPNRGY